MASRMSSVTWRQHLLYLLSSIIHQWGIRHAYASLGIFKLEGVMVFVQQVLATDLPKHVSWMMVALRALIGLDPGLTLELLGPQWWAQRPQW